MLPSGTSDLCSGNDLAIAPGGDSLRRERGARRRVGRTYAA